MALRLLLSSIVVAVALGHPTEAHDIYSHLTDSWGNSCCDEKDCRPARYRVTPTGVWMLVDGEWVEAPGYTIQYRALSGDSGETNGGHWCGRSYQRVDNSVFHVTQCAILPPGAASLLKLRLGLVGTGDGNAP
jgi:hypothetical protein